MPLIIQRPSNPKVTITNEPPKTIALFYNRGESAYEIAKANGFQGTQAQWLASMDGTAAVATHVADPTPHPAYDDLPSLNLLFENGLI